MNIYQKIYEEHYGPIPKEPNGRSYEIHHKDGNHANNDINNLQCVTIQEHYDFHFNQGDYVACSLMVFRMEMTPEEISKLRFLAAKERVEKGTHHFLGGTIQSKHNQEKLKNGTHHLLGPGNNLKRIKEGTHNFLGPESNRKRLESGTHNFIQTYICPHCGKIGKGPNMFRWHFNNCRH